MIFSPANLNERNIALRSLQEYIDTNTPSGKFFFHINAAYAEYELSKIRERTKAGLDSARSRGRVGGRKKAITPEKFKLAFDLYQSNSETVNNICKSLGINRRTFYRYVKDHKGSNNI